MHYLIEFDIICVVFNLLYCNNVLAILQRLSMFTLSHVFVKLVKKTAWCLDSGRNRSPWPRDT